MAKRLGAATFDGVHHATLHMREGLLVLKPMLRAIAAQDIRRFPVRTFHGVTS